MTFFVFKINFFFTLSKKVGIIKKVMPFFKICHTFSRFETVFFLFFCIDVILALVIPFFSLQFDMEFHQPVITFFFESVIIIGYFEIFVFRYFGQFQCQSSILVKLVYELKITLMPKNAKKNNFSSWLTVLSRYSSWFHLRIWMNPDISLFYGRSKYISASL